MIGIGTGYVVDGQRFRIRVLIGSRILSKLSRPVLESTQTPNQWLVGALSLMVMWPGCEADYWPQTTAEVKKMWIYTFIPPYTFVA
jgi:hypothetical protein